MPALFTWIGSVPKSGLLFEIATPLLLVVLIGFLRYRYPASAVRVTHRLKASANYTSAYVLASALLPLILRLALLPWLPPPQPRIPDEFGHLLVADTLLHARLANPTHILWPHFEATYVLQTPTYSSIYPIGQGMVLAVGKALSGSPWAGVLLSTMLMCGAVTWMLFGCLPPPWAAVGGLLAALHFGPANYWVNSYWGGSFCAFGGALLFGALCRIGGASSRTVLGLIAGFGWSIIWLIRPYESALLLVIAAGVISAFMLRDRQDWKRWIGPVLLALSFPAVVLVLTLLHNNAVTGSFTTLPYRLSQQKYGVPQNFLWKKAIDEPPLQLAGLKEMYEFQRGKRDWVSTHQLRYYRNILDSTWSFFIYRWYSLPLLLLVFALRDRKVLAGFCVMAATLAASGVYPFFYPHYIAAYSCVIFFLITRGLMVLSSGSVRQQPVGGLLVIFLFLGAFATTFRDLPRTALQATGIPRTPFPATFRQQVSERLANVAGRHLVFVRYTANYTVHKDYIYNDADVDASWIVWCRELSPSDDAAVVSYFKDRRVWVADVDGDNVKMFKYPASSLNSGS